MYFIIDCKFFVNCIVFVKIKIILCLFDRIEIRAGGEVGI